MGGVGELRNASSRHECTGATPAAEAKTCPRPTRVFLQITGDDPEDLAIPGAGDGFSTLKAAQALGDLQALSEARRRIVRLHLKGKQPAGLDKLAQLVRALVKQV